MVPTGRSSFVSERPAASLKPTAVIEAFQAWSGRSGLEIPFKGVHCIRHSYALHLLRQGVPLKTIGDVLGHRSPESTTVYLRLATEDLRTVALPLPTPSPAGEEAAAMMCKVPFDRRLAKDTLRYIALKQALGRRFENAITRFAQPGRFLLGSGQSSR